MSLLECEVRLGQWLVAEKAREIEKFGSTALLDSVLGGIGADGVLASSTSMRNRSFGLFAEAQRQILRALTGEDPASSIVGPSLLFQSQAIGEVQGLLDDLNDQLVTATEMVAAKPTKNTSKPNFTQGTSDLKDIGSAPLPPVTSAEDSAILRKIQDSSGDGLIDEEEIDELLKNTAFNTRRRNEDRQLVINELRERYYEVGTPDPGQDPYDPILLANFDLDPDFTFVDENGDEVESVGGMDSAQVNADGTVTFTPEFGDPVKLTIKKGGTTFRPEGFSPNTTQRRQQIKGSLSRENLEEEFAFELWACALLELLQALQNTYLRLRATLKQAFIALDLPTLILNQIPLGRVILTNLLASIEAANLITAAQNGILDGFETNADALLGFADSLRFDAGTQSRGLTVCEVNKPFYCQIHQSLNDLLADLGLDLGALELDLSRFKFDELPFDISGLGPILEGYFGLFDLLDDLDDEVEALAGQICAIIQGLMRGTPRSLSAIINGLLAFGAGLAALLILIDLLRLEIPDFGAIIDLGRRLDRAGFEAAALALLSGDLVGFLKMSAADSTFAGQTAKCLEEAARKTNNSARQARLDRMAEVARSRSNQKTGPQRIREGMDARMEFRSDSAAVEAITPRALADVAAVESEPTHRFSSVLQDTDNVHG
jgi:hypothetical protein